MQTLVRPSAPTVVNTDAIRAMDTAELLEELKNTLGLTARVLRYLAAVWLELEGRNVDLSDLKKGLLVYIPLIASGTLSPDAVVAFIGDWGILEVLSSLSLEEQKRLASGEPVKLVVRSGESFTHRMLPVKELTPAQRRQVFNTRDKCIRSESAQIAILTPQPSPMPRMGNAPKRGRCRADKRAGKVVVGRHRVEPSDILDALSDLNGEASEEPGPDSQSVSCRLTPDEHHRLKQRAAGGNVTVAALIRKALRATGTI